MRLDNSRFRAPNSFSGPPASAPPKRQLFHDMVHGGPAMLVAADGVGDCPLFPPGNPDADAHSPPGSPVPRITSANLVVNSECNDFTDALGMVALEMRKPPVSGALYRGGCISRVQRQVLSTDTPPVVRTVCTCRKPVRNLGTQTALAQEFIKQLTETRLSRILKEVR